MARADAAPSLWPGSGGALVDQLAAFNVVLKEVDFSALGLAA